MRITAHSLVPSGPQQYMHLGYLAASPSTTEIARDAGVMWLLTVACVGLAVFAFRKSLLSRIFLISVAVIALCMGLVFQRRDDNKWNDHKPAWTRSNALVILMWVDYRVAKEEKVPDSTLALDEDRVGFGTLDPWGNAYRITKGKLKGEMAYTATSAGPDGMFGTRDDIAETQTLFLGAGKGPASLDPQTTRTSDRRTQP